MSNKIDKLLEQYQKFIRLPWADNLAAEQRVAFIVYDAADERRLGNKIGDFEEATTNAGHEWAHCDLENAFPQWMSENDYKESYFEDPDDLEMALEDFLEYLTRLMRKKMGELPEPENTVFALSGTGALFGFAKVSDLVSSVVEGFEGHLVVFFPGKYENNQYRHLGVSGGWNYLAAPITEHMDIGD